MPDSGITYVVKKGDTLTLIAKQQGVANGMAIWQAPQNKSIASKRGKPESIQPGDKLFIPPDPRARAELAKKLAALQKSRDATLKLRKGLADQSDSLKQRIKVMDDLIKDHRKSTDDILGDLGDLRERTKKLADTVDAVATVAKTLAGIGMLAKGTRAALAKGGEELVKKNAEALKFAKDMAASPLTEGGPKIVAKLADNENKALAAAGIVAESWEKLSSPSFWANTTIQLFVKKKSWSEAVTSEVGAEVEERIAIVKRESAKGLQQLQNNRTQLASHLASNEGLIKDCEAQIKSLETEVGKLSAIK